jgi:UDP-N-acetyl-D-glucosamine dehydrogenase
MKLLAERGAQITYYDPYVPVSKSARDYSQFAGRKSVAWNRATIENLISFASRRPIGQ